MSESLTTSITFKCTYEEKNKFEAIARSRRVSTSAFIRECCIKEIQVVEELLNSLSKEFGLTTDTFQLEQPVQVLKTAGTKKAQQLRPVELSLPFHQQ